MRRDTRAPSGPTITRVSFNINEVQAALTAYAEANDGALLDGACRVTSLKVSQTGEAAVLEVRRRS